MAAKTRRAYKGGALETTLSAPLNAGNTTFQITAYTGWPYGSDPFYVVVEPGTANEEKMLVTRSGSTDLTLSVVSGGRGVDDTSDLTHNTGSVIYPVFTAVDADEANELASTLTSKGDLLTMDSGPSFDRLAVGTDDYVLVADSGETTGLKWAQVATASIEDGAVTEAKLANSAVTDAKLADSLVTGRAAVNYTGTTQTLALTDAERTLYFDNAAQVTVTIPTNASVAFLTGTRIVVYSAGAGGVTLSTAGLTVLGANTTCDQYEAMYLEKYDTDSWIVIGGTS